MLRLHVHSSQQFGLNLLLAFATFMPPKPPWRHEMQDVQESRGRASRDNRSARRAADAAVSQQREQWCQAGQPSSGPSQQAMQPSSQRWRKLKELEANVDKQHELMNVQAEQQHHQFLLRQQSLQYEEEQLAKLKNVLYQQQVMLTQQTQFLHGYAWTVQSKEMLLEERAIAEVGPLQSTSSSSTGAVQPVPERAPLLSTSSPSAKAIPVQPSPEPAFVQTTSEPVTAVIQVAADHVDLQVDIEVSLIFDEITDDFRAVFDGFTLDFKEHGKPPKLVVLQHGFQLFVKGAKLGDEVTGVKHPADKVLHRAKSIDEAVELLCESTSLTLRRPVSHTPAVNDPRRVDGKLRVKVYPKPVYPYPAPCQ